MAKLSYSVWLVDYLENMDQDEVDSLGYYMNLYNEDRKNSGLSPITFGEYLRSEFEISQENG